MGITSFSLTYILAGLRSNMDCQCTVHRSSISKRRVCTFHESQWRQTRTCCSSSRSWKWLGRTDGSVMNHMKACKGSKLSIQQRIANYLSTYRSTRYATTDRTPAGLFLGRELRIRLTVLRPSVWEKMMDSQAKQKATHDAHTKLREFYPSDRVVFKDHSTKLTWWPGSIAKRSGLKYY